MSSIVVKYSIDRNTTHPVPIKFDSPRSQSLEGVIGVVFVDSGKLFPLLRIWNSLSLGLFILNCTLIWTCGNTTHLSFVFIHSAPRTSYGTTLFANISHARLDSQISDAVQEKISSTV